MTGPDDQRGQTTLLILGLATVLLMLGAVVTDASAAYLQRQALDTIADGAALTAADAAATGAGLYRSGVGADLRLDPAAARSAVAAYLRRAGAARRYPGLRAQVRLDPAGRRVVVRVAAAIRLPLHVPGSPRSASVGATGAASVRVDAAATG